MIESLNKPKSQDLSNFYLITIVCGAVTISLITLIAVDFLPVGLRQPGSPVLQSAAIIGSMLLILSFLAILAKRFGKSGKSGFKAHVWLANIGFILIIAHSGLAVLSIPGILLILIIVVVLFGTKKLRNVGADLGAAMKSFKKSSKEDTSSNKSIDDDNQNKNS